MDLDLREDIEAVQGYIKSLSKYDVGESKVPSMQNLKFKIASFSDDREQLDKLCKELYNLQVEWDTYKKLFKELQSSQDDVKELSLRHQECNEELDYGMTMQKSLFEKAFGMQIKLTADKAVSFVFQHLSPAHWDTTCCITLDVNSEGQWEVVQMEPSLSGVQVLLDQLNKTNKLNIFCKNIRTKFKEHLAPK